MIFDCHFHIEKGTAGYNIDVAGRNVIFNSFESYHNFKDMVTDADSMTIIFDYRNYFAEVQQLMQERKVAALKIHNRIQKIGEQDYGILLEHLSEARPGLPVVIDAFYFGDDLEYQPSLKSVISIARRFPDIPVIVAHCGGIEILKYFYHLRSLENIHFDLSFSLAYLKNTSVFTDYKNLLKYGAHDKILFGTDYPFVDARLQLDAFNEIASGMNIAEAAVERMLYGNAQRIFKPK